MQDNRGPRIRFFDAATHGAMCQSILMLFAQDSSNRRFGSSMKASPISATQG